MDKMTHSDTTTHDGSIVMILIGLFFALFLLTGIMLVGVF